MDELTFEILEINTEKRMDGNTYIKLKCVQDNKIVDIIIKSTFIDNKGFIKMKAIDEYTKHIGYETESIIRIGDII